MSYIEKKIDLVVSAARTWCGRASEPLDLRQDIAVDVLHLCGLIFTSRHPVLLAKVGKLLSVFPLLKRDAEGPFLAKLLRMEDMCLSIVVDLEKIGVEQTKG